MRLSIPNPNRARLSSSIPKYAENTVSAADRRIVAMASRKAYL